MIRRSVLPLLSALLALAACDGPTASTPGLAIEVMAGNAQEGLPGQPLPAQIILRAVRPDGQPAAGTTVIFQPAAGAGTVQPAIAATDAYGLVRAAWLLPDHPGGDLRVTARAEGADETVQLTATWLPRARADLLVADVPERVRLLLHAPGVVNAHTAFQADFYDSIIVAPFAEPQARGAVIAFADGHPPLVRDGIGWTAGRDTLRLAFPRPVSVPLTLWVVRGPYDEVRTRMELQLTTARSIWARAGIRFEDVRWVDATAYPNAPAFQGTTDACGGAPGMIGKDLVRTNVYVVGGPLMDRGVAYGGYACNPEFISMAVGALGAPTLFAHELGHTFSLGHLTGADNVMDPSGQFYGVTAGQIFHAHAHSISSIQILFGDRAVVPGRDCRPLGAPCLPAALDL